MIVLNFVFTLAPPKSNHSYRGQSWLSPARYPLGIILPGSFSRPLWSPTVSHLLSPQSQNPLNSSLKLVSLCCPGACCTHAIMSCLSFISRHQKQFQQMLSGQEKDETQKPHRQWPVKNFTSWKVNSLLLLWTFPYRLQCMSLVYQDTVRDISWNRHINQKIHYWNTWHWIQPT